MLFLTTTTPEVLMTISWDNQHLLALLSSWLLLSLTLKRSKMGSTFQYYFKDIVMLLVNCAYCMYLICITGIYLTLMDALTYTWRKGVALALTRPTWPLKIIEWLMNSGTWCLMSTVEESNLPSLVSFVSILLLKLHA